MLNNGDNGEKRQVFEALGRIGVDESTAALVTPGLVATLSTSDVDLKDTAIRALGGLGGAGKNAVTSLIRLLDDPLPPIRQSALRALARIGNLPTEIRPRLLEFAKDKDDYTRAWAAIALLRINPSDEFAKGLALECLRPERPRTLRSSTLYLILGMHGEAAIFEKDLRRLTSDQDKIVSMWSRQALKSIGAKEVQAGSGASSAH